MVCGDSRSYFLLAYSYCWHGPLYILTHTPVNFAHIIDSQMMSLYSYTFCAGISSSTAIEARKCRIPFDLRSEARYRSISTKVGDDLGIPSAVVFFGALRCLVHVCARTRKCCTGEDHFTCTTPWLRRGIDRASV